MLSSTLFTTALCAVAARAAMPSTMSSCSSGPVSQYMPLANFPPAQSYCAANYPSPATVTISSCSLPATSTGAAKRNVPGSPQPQWRGDHGLPPPPPPGQTILFKQLMGEDTSTISTFCSCIGSQPRVITVQTTCAASEYCDAPTSTCKIQRDCKNPASCDGHSFCGTGPTGTNLFCHQDTDNSTAGYCMNDGPPNLGCPEPYENCTSNADCGGQRVCIYSCCRTEPFCVDVRDYQSGFGSPASRLMRRGDGLMNPWAAP